MFSWFSGSKTPGERSSLGQSLASTPSDVKGRLNFSSTDTPRPPGHDRRPLLPPSGGVSGRLGEYHRSKQNPDVLDQYLPRQSPSHLSQNLYKNSPVPPLTSERFNMFSSPQGITGFPLSSFRRALTPLRTSLLPPGMLSDRQVSPFSTSLVSMAVRSRLCQPQGLGGVSPVIVHLSNTSNSSPSGSNPPNTNEGTRGEVQPDPCDKEVVMSALKLKRKRWVCPSDDITASVESQQPAAKRSRHATDQQRSHSLPPPSPSRAPPPPPHGRKRELTATASSSLTQSLKKPRVFRPPSPSQQQQQTLSSTGESEDMEVAKVKHHVTMPETGQPREHHVPVRPGSGSVSSRPSLKLLVPDPDSEYELDSESVRCAPGGGVKGDGVEESSVDSGRGSRGSTPPVQEEDDNENREEEIARKHKAAELQKLRKSLTAVFPSHHNVSSRRKVPVFCATGGVPLQPPALSSTHSVTREDWRKEREAARARLRSFLAADDDPPTKPPAAAVTPTSTKSPAISTPQVTQTTPQPSTISTTTTPASTAPLVSTTSQTVKTQSGTKAVTFQLPNIATSSQSMTSVASSTSGMTPSVQQSGTGTGLVPGSGLKLGSQLAEQPSAITSSTPSLPSSSSASSGLSLSGSTSLTSTATQQQQQQQQTTLSQQQTATQQQNQSLASFGFGLSGSSLPQTASNSTTVASTQPAITTTITLSSGLAASLLLPTASSQLPPAAPSTTSGLSMLATQQAINTTNVLPSTAALARPAPTVSLQSSSVLPTQQAFNTTSTLPSATTQPSLWLPAAPPPQQAISTTTEMSPSGPMSLQPPRTAPTQQATNPSTAPSLASSLSGPSLSGPMSMQLTAFGPNSISAAQPTALSNLMFASQGATTTTAPTAGSLTGGFSFGSGGMNLTSVASSGTSSVFSHLSQTSSSGQSGGIFKLGQTPSLTSTAVTTSAAPTFSFSAGGGGGFKFSSGGSTQQQQPSEQKSKILFGGGLQSTQKPGGLSLGGIFGTPATTTSAVPTFNFSATSSLATGGPQQQKLSGGTFGNAVPQTSSNPPTFNFGSSTTQPQQQQQQTNKNMFGFSATQQQQQLSSGGMQFGAVSSAGGTMFNFSGSTSKAGSSLSATGSGTGLIFGAPTPSQGSSGGGFNFSAGSLNPAGAGGGFNFGTTANNPISGTSASGLFGSSTNQNQAGGTFGQTTPQNNSLSTSRAGALFNPSITTPSNPAQPSLGGFNFTPQPATNSGFNFNAGGTGTPSGGIFGSPGVVKGTLFSAGTPRSNEPTRPVATARRRRGRRK